MVPLPDLAGAIRCAVSDISDDGIYSVGYCFLTSSGRPVPVRWTGTDAPINLGVPSGFTSASANRTNQNGSVVTGVATGILGSHTYLWISGSPPENIEAAVGFPGSEGYAVTGSGSSIIVAGVLYPGDGSTVPYRWTAATGMLPLPLRTGGTFGTMSGVSDDGRRIVGSSTDGSGVQRACFWNADSSLSEVGADVAASSVFAISGDGTTLAGNSQSGIWIWTGTTTQLLGPLLTSLGVELGTFTLGRVYGISRNGKVMVGTGAPDAATDEGWIAILP
jgi:uncharacterized membrane protein